MIFLLLRHYIEFIILNKMIKIYLLCIIKNKKINVLLILYNKIFFNPKYHHNLIFIKK